AVCVALPAYGPSGPTALGGRQVETLRCQRRVEVSLRARLNFLVARLSDERGQPSNFELAANDDEEVRLVQSEDEARLGFHEMWILVSLRERLRLYLVARNFFDDCLEVLRRRHDSECGARLRRVRQKDRGERDRSDYQSLHDHGPH